MSIDPQHAPRSASDLGRWMRWVEERLKYLGSSRNVIKNASVAGGAVTIIELLTEPNASVRRWIDTDETVWSGTGAITINLTDLPYSRSLTIYWDGIALDPAEWTLVGPLVTVTPQSYYRAGHTFRAHYETDTVAPSEQVPTPRITSPTAGSFTTDDTPTVTGTGAEGRTITVKIDGATIGTTTVSGGVWSVTSSTLSAAAHTIIAYQSQPGSSDLASTPVSFTVLTMTFDSALASFGPLAWWKHNESVAPTINDSSGNGHDGTYTPNSGTFSFSEPSLVPSEPTDHSVKYAGGNYGSVVDGAWMDVSTIALVAVISETTPGHAIVARDHYPGDRIWGLGTDSTDHLQFYLWTAGGLQQIISTGTVSPGDFVAASYNGSVMKVFINGVPDPTTLAVSGAIISGGARITIGAVDGGSIGQPIYFMDGWMQHVAIFTSLTDANIAALATAGGF